MQQIQSMTGFKGKHVKVRIIVGIVKLLIQLGQVELIRNVPYTYPEIKE